MRIKLAWPRLIRPQQNSHASQTSSKPGHEERMMELFGLGCTWLTLLHAISVS
jgi:hypothetical protein